MATVHKHPPPTTDGLVQEQHGSGEMTLQILGRFVHHRHTDVADTKLIFRPDSIRMVMRHVYDVSDGQGPQHFDVVGERMAREEHGKLWRYHGWVKSGFLEGGRVGAEKWKALLKVVESLRENLHLFHVFQGQQLGLSKKRMQLNVTGASLSYQDHFPLATGRAFLCDMGRSSLWVAGRCVHRGVDVRGIEGVFRAEFEDHCARPDVL